MARKVTEDFNETAHRVVQEATGERNGMAPPLELEIAIAHLINTDRDWANVIRGCVEWSEALREQGGPGQFTRESVYYRLGRTDGGGAKLTPLVKAGVLKRSWTNAKGKPYYELAQDTQVILSALSRAVA